MCCYTSLLADHLAIPFRHHLLREKFGGPKATALVDYKKDPAVIAICDTWAGDYVSDSVRALGFKVDSRETGYEDAVRDFVEDLEEAKKGKA